jgi:threonine dehydrogenase-like Zn-dependent dehydrogenase
VGLFFERNMLPFTLRQAIALMGVMALAACAIWAYHLGGKAVQADWNAERAEMAAMALQDAEAARAKERELQRKADDVQAKLNANKKLAAAAAATAADELRLLQAALAARGASESTASTTRVDGASTGELLLECVKIHSGVASEADTLANKVTAFQEYSRAIANACQSRSSGAK